MFNCNSVSYTHLDVYKRQDGFSHITDSVASVYCFLGTIRLYGHISARACVWQRKGAAKKNTEIDKQTRQREDNIKILYFGVECLLIIFLITKWRCNTIILVTGVLLALCNCSYCTVCALVYTGIGYCTCLCVRVCMCLRKRFLKRLVLIIKLHNDF